MNLPVAIDNVSRQRFDYEMYCCALATYEFFMLRRFIGPTDCAKVGAA